MRHSWVKPFLVALAAGLGIVWLYRKYQQNKNLAAITYTDPKTGNPVYAGPDIDPQTGVYTGPDAGSGTLGATQHN